MPFVSKNVLNACIDVASSSSYDSKDVTEVVEFKILITCLLWHRYSRSTLQHGGDGKINVQVEFQF